MTYQEGSKKFPTFECEKCDYICSKQSLWDKHCSTLKHKNTYFDLPKGEKSFHICACGKSYNHKQSLYNHKKKCLGIASTSEKQNNIVYNLLYYLTSTTSVFS